MSVEEQELLAMKEALKNYQQTYAPIYEKLSDPKTSDALRGLLINGLAQLPGYYQRVHELSVLITEKEDALRNSQLDCLAPQEDAGGAMTLLGRVD